MMRVISASSREHSFAITESPSSFIAKSRYTSEWPWLSRVIRLGTALAPVSRFQATTAGCSARVAIEISTGIRSATGNTPSQCQGIGRGIESARAGVFLGRLHGALQRSMFHFQSNITMLQRAHPVGDEENRLRGSRYQASPNRRQPL